MSEVQDRDELGISSIKKKQLVWQVANKDNFCLFLAEIKWIDYIQLICVDWKVLFTDQDNHKAVQPSCSTFPWNLVAEHKFGENSVEEFLA